MHLNLLSSIPRREPYINCLGLYLTLDLYLHYSLTLWSKWTLEKYFTPLFVGPYQLMDKLYPYFKRIELGVVNIV